MKARAWLMALSAALQVCSVGQTPEAVKPAAHPAHAPVYVSDIVSKKYNRSVDISASIGGAKKLYLVVLPADTKSTSEHIAQWMEPRVVGPAGIKRLSDLPTVSATSADGEVSKNRTIQGFPFKHLGETVEYGFGVKGPSVIEFDLPEGYAQFLAVASVDLMDPKPRDPKANVRFAVFTDQPGTAALPLTDAEMAAAKKLEREKKLQEYEQLRKERKAQELEKQRLKLEEMKRKAEEKRAKK